jgi:glutaredoxin
MSAMTQHPTAAKTAVVHRMAMPSHTCPYGLKALHLLRRSGYEVEDRHLTSREQTDAFKAEHDVATTPQIFIGGRRIGGYDDLRRFLGKRVADPKAASYRPVIALVRDDRLDGDGGEPRRERQPVHRSGGRMVHRLLDGRAGAAEAPEHRDLRDHVPQLRPARQRWVPYGYVYPFAEGLAGVLMIAGALSWLSVPIALFIGTVGAVSVFKAVYVDRRELKCACVGGSSKRAAGLRLADRESDDDRDGGVDGACGVRVGGRRGSRRRLGASPPAALLGGPAARVRTQYRRWPGSPFSGRPRRGRAGDAATASSLVGHYAFSIARSQP